MGYLLSLSADSRVISEFIMVKNALQAQLLKAGLVDNKKAKNPVPVAKKDPTYYPDIYALSHESDIPASSYNKAEIQESAHFQARVLQS